MKKTLSLLLSLIMVATTFFALPFTANALVYFARFHYEATPSNYINNLNLGINDDKTYQIKIEANGLDDLVGLDEQIIDEIMWMVTDSNGKSVSNWMHESISVPLPKYWTAESYKLSLKPCETYKVYCIGFDAGGNELQQMDYIEFTVPGAAIDEAHFPDANFRDFVKKYDSNKDNCLDLVELLNESYLNLTNQGIKDITGIEYFYNADSFVLVGNDLTEIDLSKNPKLKALQIGGSYTKIEKLNISECTDLQMLGVCNNDISSLDISKNSKLYYLAILNTKVSSLDLSNNAELDTIMLVGNPITKLDITKTAVYTTSKRTGVVEGSGFSDNASRNTVVFMTDEQKQNYENYLEEHSDTKDINVNVIPHAGHTYTSTTTKATTSADGKIVKKCACGDVESTNIIKKVSTVKLSSTKYTYDGKAKSPTLTVKDSAGKALVKGTDYTVTTPSGRKAVGKYTYKITFKGKYSGTKTLNFTIVPKATSISSLTAASKGFTAKWKKQATQTTGYQIRYSTKSSMASAKTVTVSKNSTVSKKITKLTGKKKYYVQVRTYKTVSGTKYYSAWSKSKTVTTKK